MFTPIDLLFAFFFACLVAVVFVSVVYALASLPPRTITITRTYHDHCTADTHNIEHHNYPEDDGPDGHYFDDIVPIDPPPTHSASRIAPRLAECCGSDDGEVGPARHRL